MTTEITVSPNTNWIQRNADLTPEDQVDVAVALGVLPEPLPDLIADEELLAMPCRAPREIVSGILHQGCKLVLAGTSKSNKTWALMDLAISVASGQPWWGYPTSIGPVVYINFELPRWAIKSRREALMQARSECQPAQGMLYYWNLRGHGADLTSLRKQIEDAIRKYSPVLIIIDPLYKLLGKRDENSNGDMADLMNELDRLAQSAGAAIAFAHHFAKGNSADKAAIDRLSGAGVVTRDQDSILTLTPHEEEESFTLSGILRHHKKLQECVLTWQYPLLKIDLKLNPDSLRNSASKRKVTTDQDFIDKILTEKPAGRSEVVERAKNELSMSRATTDKYLNRLSENNLIGHRYGTYWAK